MPSAVIEAILSDPWVQQRRDEGKAIMVIGNSGRLHHADPGVAAWLGRDELGDNGFDLVPPEMTALGAQLMSKYSNLDAYTVWFPMIHGDNTEHWYRWDGRRMEGLLVEAISPEPDPALHRVDMVPA